MLKTPICAAGFEIEGDIFEVLRAYYRQSLLFSQEHPDLHTR